MGEDWSRRSAKNTALTARRGSQPNLYRIQMLQRGHQVHSFYSEIPFLPALLKKHKGEKVSVVAKIIGEQWKDVSDAEKSKFQKKADKLKAQVAAEQKKYAKTTSAKNYAAARKEFAKEKKAAMKA